MNDLLVPLLAKRFIQRRDVFARQTDSGGYMPVLEHKDGPRVPIKGRHILEHLDGTRTYGHYLLDQDDMCRLFAFDIDLEKISRDENNNIISGQGWYPQGTDLDPFGSHMEPEYVAANPPLPIDAREAWRDRRHPSRPWLKIQMRMLAAKFARVISEELGIGTAVAYTGNKGIHVYGFTGPQPASIVRDGAMLVLDSLGEFEAFRGQNFFRSKNMDAIEGYPNFTIEVFPKQTSLDGKDLGNLMRLPLGKNLKAPKDPTFFVDMRAPFTELVPDPDPVKLLETGNPWL